MPWQLQEAKNKLSRVVQQAQSEGPQVITVHGKETAVLLSVEEYRKLTGREENLVDFFQRSPLQGVELDVARSKDLGRDIEL